MKKWYILITLIIISNFVYSQKIEESSVPKDVLATMKQKFPNAKKLKWEKTKKGDFKVKFKKNERKFNAKFISTGEIKYFEKHLSINELPPIATEYVSKNYPKMELGKIKLRQKADGKKYYRVNLKKDGEKKMTLRFKKDGSFKKVEG